MSVHHDWSGLTAPDTFRYPSIRVQARGDFACFTRPELVSERVSYPVMTPTAAVGLLSATLWKPQFRWVIERIEVLAKVSWTTMRRNESETAITRDHLARGYLDVDNAVQQRMTTMLRDVHYRIHANVWVHPDAVEQDPAKWRAQFTRRVERGQSFRQPFLGMREFHADVTPADDTKPITWNEDLGVMLHSINYNEQTGAETYDWFDAKIVNGVLDIPRAGLMAEAGKAGV
ncbi:type I-C CRISPR-associated protein Cas5c [Gordonia sp. (in: high G+C Gram-positive bacteria)]|uniref:type I-C CRISPR-associated protein Cas5c n=1 Tax=Gordonia sp. (in: high G+C Gram-positive bacteria) TaxID=84139 RepID=UPI001D425542|nr:type I-C CRISPR-associated protein Cas5c [Gordonia sp. (in: high G+C Gram-positive bacteria)]MCB1293993.1 type I-C CRISPR-associated protein Cas5 [Gordonia sp. (in: high G+C Gram-positive bacteria)]HMS75568.1 type I-C CRISPR-associated protein Cas5c [Gordonia sp. (in: high G+C Gram-positive bacteria)]HQV16857.1 type I-C CRISPR-associated protein Cas5c [Gordonia sp. (in: high G+C Gram-positive bacteria)]